MAGRHKKNLAQRCAFEECLRQHEGLTLQCLPPAARFHYTLSRNDQDLVLPITLRTPESSRVRCKYLDSVQQGVIVCWFGLEKIVLIQAPTQLKKLALSCVQRDGLETQTVSQLAQGLDGLLDNTALLARPEDLAKDLSYNRGQGSQAIEAQFTNWLTQHSAGDFTKSFEGCLCDGWLSRDSRPEVLPIQLKASARSPTCGDFAFSCKKLYPTMLVMLRHVIADKGTFVSPGALLPAKGVCGTWKGKFSRYSGPRRSTDGIPRGPVPSCGKSREKPLTWPSGESVDISSPDSPEQGDPKHPYNGDQTEGAAVLHAQGTAAPRARVQEHRARGRNRGHLHQWSRCAGQDSLRLRTPVSAVQRAQAPRPG